ncbi:MAG: tetratricopeptide repeat protein [Bacteroidota bacterium]
MSNQDRIDQYLSGALAPEALAAFRAELRTNEVLAKELAEVRKTQLVVKATIRQDMRQRAQQQWEKQRAPARLIPVRWWLGAAAVLLLISFLGWWFWESSSPQGPELYAQYFVAPPPPSTRTVVTKDSLWLPAITAYRAGQYPTAIAYFNQLDALPDSSRFSESKLYLGISYLATEKFASAVATLKQIPENSPLLQDAEWYLVLAFLGNSQIDLAEPILQKIAQDERHFKQAEAKRILAVL